MADILIRSPFPADSDHLTYPLMTLVDQGDGTHALKISGGGGGSAGGAPTDANYLVGTANSGLSAEIVVGTTPGGELGGTWGTPTVDETHSGSSHAGIQTAAESTAAVALAAHTAAADPHAGYVLESLLDAKGDLITASADNTPARLAAGANDSILMADSAEASGLKWVAPAAPVAVSTANSEGTSDDFARASHVHAHEAAHLAHDTLWDAAGDLVIGTGADAAAKLSIGAAKSILSSDGTTASWIGGAWQTYAVTITASTNPTIGNGTLTGRYRYLTADVVMVRIYFLFGSTSNAGVGQYAVSLPVTSHASGEQMLPARLLDSGTSHFPAVGIIGASASAISGIGVADASGTKLLTNTVPFTWATGDVLVIEGAYEV